MLKAIKYLLLLLLLLIGFASCVPHKAYVTNSFEPIVINQKNDKQLSFGIRPFRYLYTDFTHAVSDKIMYKFNIGGFWKMGNASTAILYYNNFNKSTLYTGPTFNYNINYGNLDGYIVQAGDYYKTNYKCEFYSPGLVIGYNYFRKENKSHQLIINIKYNFNQKYDYHYLTGIGGMSGYTNRLYDDETLNETLNPFFSYEISYAKILKTKKNNLFKLQVGMLYLQKVFEHKYTYESHGYSNQTIDKTTLHPVSTLINFSVGYIFKLNKQNNKTQEI